jgi:hypothetical protein
MSYPTCNHLKEDGVYCDSPALRDQKFCYFHLNARARRLQMAQARRRGETCRIQLPVLEDMHAVQVSLQQVLEALADDRIDHKRAGLMLYALQQAATTLNCTPEWKGSRPQVELDHPLRAIAVPNLEEQYALPNDIDLEAPPEVAVAEAELKENLPPGQPINKPAHPRLERVANFRPRMYFRDVDERHANSEDESFRYFRKLRRSLNESLAAHAGEDPEDAADPVSARPPLPHQFYGEVNEPEAVRRVPTRLDAKIRLVDTSERETSENDSQPLTHEEFALNYFCDDDFRKKFEPSLTK